MTRTWMAFSQAVYTINKYMEDNNECHLTSTMVVLYPKEEEMVSERRICAPSPPQWSPNGNTPGDRRTPSVLIRTQMPKKKNVQNINYLACMEAKKITHQDKLHRYCDQNEARCTLGGRNSQERTGSCWLSWPPHTCLHTKINVIKINTGWLHIHVGSRIAKETERKGTGKRAHLVGSFRFCKVWRSVDQVNLCNTLNCTLTNS